MGTVRNHGLRVLGLSILVMGFAAVTFAAPPEQLSYHQIKTDANGDILPWYSSDPGEAYNHVILKIWQFWKDMKSCPNGVKYYMQHQVWQDPGEDPRGIGGDQIAMALSSWNLLYGYTGDRSIVDNMIYMADYTISHGFSRPDALWPNLPYPYNTELHSGIYDGDMRAGKGYLQPDKAASFAAELMVLYKITGNEKYLKTAEAIADTLARKITPGDADHSPWPYRVNATTGQVNLPYTTNYTGALLLFEDLVRLHHGKVASYRSAFGTLSAWLKKYPLKNNKWGPFFEDVPGWSDTEINADTMAWYILEHPDWDPNWREDSKAILAWSQAMFENKTWAKYGVTVTNEQTAYRVPGNSHTSRHASVKLIYAEKTGDASGKAEAIRELNWATYMVGEEGNNRYPYDDVWLTDGYGDYVRHYLRSMAAFPELAPKGQNHLLSTTSVIKRISYAAESVSYTTFDDASQELLRVNFTPTAVLAGGKRLLRFKDAADLERQEGYTFEPSGDVPGVLRIRHDFAAHVVVTGEPVNQPPVARSESLTVDQGATVTLKLEATDDGLPKGKQLTYAITGPYWGSVTGTAPELAYTPPVDFVGTDLVTFTASDGELESNTVQITVHVVRPNLARLPGTRPFTTEDPQGGAPGLFTLPGLADGDVTTSVNAGFSSQVPRNVSIGVLWHTAESIRQVVFREGSVTEQGNGFFDEAPRLEVSSDGTDWRDATGYVMSPAHYSANVEAGMQDVLFSLGSAASVRGVRVTGRVGKTGPSSSDFPHVRELEVYASLSSPQPPQITANPKGEEVYEGTAEIYSARPAQTAFATYQWQKSTDQGKTWQDIPGANSSFYVTPPVHMSDNGTQFRCVISTGTPPDAASNPATLTVVQTGHVMR